LAFRGGSALGIGVLFGEPQLAACVEGVDRADQRRYCVAPRAFGSSSLHDLHHEGCGDFLADQWTLAWEPNGFYRIINRASGHCISTLWRRADWSQLTAASCDGGVSAEIEWQLRIG
jgi:hypothetical protein